MRLLSAILLTAFLFSSCRFLGYKRINGNGNIVSRQANIGSFNSLDVSGSVVIHLRQGAENSARIETDENLMEHLEIFTKGNTLVVRPRNNVNLRPSKDVVLYATAPGFRDIEISGASKLISDNTITGNEALNLNASGSSEISMQVSVPQLQTELSGSSHMNIRGQAASFEADVSGSSEIRCLDLVTDNTRLDLSGASEVEVTANKRLDVNASGASNVSYRGNAVVNQRTSGAGSVRRL